MKFVVLSIAAIAAAMAPVNGYSITDTNSLNCRSGPGTNFDVVRKYTKGDDIQISCQQAGEKIKTDELWDKTQDGCFVADYYVKTGTKEYVAPKCEGGNGGNPPPPPPPPPSGSGACTGINQAGLDLIKDFEGFVAKPEPDPIGLPTVGYGHLCETKGCAEVKQGFPLTPATAEQLLKSEIPGYASCFAKGLKSSVTLNQNQWAALVSWVYNVGCGGAKKSTLVQRLNKGEDPNTVAREELIQWNKAGGRVFSGLTRRRKAEIALFTTANNQQAHPNCSA
ncbi:hypothetical protein GGI12_004325 [Dipsacomyces acuminosporus]|nr:hypothetical protein GGI12_004325 [Dipsacomyces acuminosporus]